MNASDCANSMNFNKNRDEIDLVPLLCTIYKVYTSDDKQAFLAEIDKYVTQPDALVKKLTNIPALILKVDTYLTENITQSSQENMVK